MFMALVSSQPVHWKNIDEAQYATLDWVGWFNNRRILEPIGNIPPAEYELMYYQ
jgi:putative transposase